MADEPAYYYIEKYNANRGPQWNIQHLYTTDGVRSRRSELAYLIGRGLGANTMLNSGLSGSEVYFATVAQRHHHDVAHLSFSAHKKTTPPPAKLLCVVVKPQSLCRVDGFLWDTAQKLNRLDIWRNGEYLPNLMRCKTLIAIHAMSLYVIVATFEYRSLAEGAESMWTPHLFMRILTEQKHPTSHRPLYVFCQQTAQWFQFHVVVWAKRTVAWKLCEDPPAPCGVYGAIGTCNLNATGRGAIDGLFGDT